MGSWKRLLNRPVRWWADRRHYPVREKIFSLVPKPCASGCGRMLLVQALPETAADAAWTARSFQEGLGGLEFDIRFVLDGDAKEAGDWALRLQALFPGAEVRTAESCGEEFRERCPHLHGLASVNPMGRKLMAVLDANRSSDVLYSDADVLCLGPAPELAEWIKKEQACYLQDVAGGNFDAKLLGLAHSRGLNHETDLNAGLTFSPRNVMDAALAEELVAELNEEDLKSWFVEQTLTAILMWKAGGKPLERERYVLSGKGQFFSEEDEDYCALAIRHFITPVRHRMYAAGMPHLWHKWRVKGIV